MSGFNAATPQARESTHKVQPTPSRQNKDKKVHKLILLKSVETTMVMNKQNLLNNPHQYLFRNNYSRLYYWGLSGFYWKSQNKSPLNCLYITNRVGLRTISL